MSSSLLLHYIHGVRLGEVKNLDGGFYYRTINVSRTHPHHGDDKPLSDVAEVTLISDAPQKLLTENEKQLIALIKAMLAAMESSSISGISTRLQELRKAVEKIEGGH